jgi:prepilin-type N-terminal cleavage/methylation domain-containing protein/prepilin-type processing-associated H-X9-DG protein
MLTRNPKRPCTTGFTLIELLVVVAIIALLVSILLPSLSWARARARELICLTHLRALGDAARVYAGDNNDYIPRGIQWFGGGGEYAIFATAILKYVGYDGKTLGMWHDPATTEEHERMCDIFRSIPVYQCPDYPDEVKENEFKQPGTNPFDYVVSAFAMPYPQECIEEDAPHELEWEEFGGMQWEWVGDGYISASRLEDMPQEANLASKIYLTEAHVYLTWTYSRDATRYHTFFLTSQLPFGGRPRIANDQRHPGGLNALFFDGHGATMDLHEMDRGWPNGLETRLKWFTVMPDDYEEG